RLAVLRHRNDRGCPVRRDRALVRAAHAAGGRMTLTTTITDYFVGIDIGQVSDSTAFGVIERHRAIADLRNLHHALHDDAKQEARDTPTRLDLVHLHRIPLGVTYPVQVNILDDLLQRPELRGARVY